MCRVLQRARSCIPFLSCQMWGPETHSQIMLIGCIHGGAKELDLLMSANCCKPFRLNFKKESQELGQVRHS